MKQDLENKVSLFEKKSTGKDYSLDDINSCGLPTKKKNHYGILIVFIVLACIVIAASLFMTFNWFNVRTIVFSFLSSNDSENSSLMEESETLSISESVIESEAPESSMESSIDSVETSVSEEPTHGWVINQLGYTYLYNGYGLEQFNFNEATLNKFVNLMDELSKRITTTSRFYCMPIPTRISYFNSEIPAEIRREDNFYNSSQKDYLDALGNALPSKMELIDLYSGFAEAYQNGNDPYFKSDKNWTSDAAYLAYLKYCEKRKFTPVELTEYEKKTNEGYLGSFYYATGNEIMQNNPESFVYYQSKATADSENIVYQNGLTFKNYCLADNYVGDVSNSYFTYLGTSGAHFKITTKAGTGNKMLIIGDQSAAAMIPFLINHFNEIHYYDIYQGTDSIEDIVKQARYNDILVCAYMTNTVKGDFPTNLARVLGVLQENDESNE